MNLKKTLVVLTSCYMTVVALPTQAMDIELEVIEDGAAMKAELVRSVEKTFLTGVMDMHQTMAKDLGMLAEQFSDK